MTEDDKALAEVVVVGRAAEDFFGSRVGKYIVNKLESEIEDGLQRLRGVDCNDARAIQDAQNQVWRAESVLQWLGQAVEDGLRAEHVLIERD